jgi:hypothetical protein
MPSVTQMGEGAGRRWGDTEGMIKPSFPRPTRADVAEYIHDMALELAEIAAKNRLSGVHDRLVDAARQAQAAAQRTSSDDADSKFQAPS